MSRFMRRNSERSGSQHEREPAATCPAAKLRPVGPRITARPPVMYSHAVVADAFDHRGRAGVAHAEALADDAADEHVAAGRAVEDHVAGDDVLLGDELRGARRPQHERAAREPLAEVVVGVAFEPQRDAARARTHRSSGPPSRGT